MPHPYLILATMTGAIAMIMVDQTVVGIILPSLQRDMALNHTQLMWVVNGYALALSASLVAGGWVGDRFGRFKAFTVGCSMFVLSSLGCAFAPSAEFLVAARVFQGIGAAMMQPSASAIVFVTFPDNERGKAMSIYAGVGMLFLAAGPLLGGFIVESYSWNVVFLINVPIGIITVLSVLLNGKNHPHINAEKFDFLGAILLVVGTVSLIMAIKAVGDASLSTYTIASMCTVGVASYLWMYHRRIAVPESLFDFSFFQSKEFLCCTLMLFCIQFALLGQVVYGAIFIQNVLDFSPLMAGLAMLPVVLSIAVVSQIAGRILDRYSFRPLAIYGTLLIAFGFISQAIVLHMNNLMLLIPGMLMMGIGLGMLVSTVTTEALRHVPIEKSSKASGMVQTIRQLGGVFGVAAIGALVNKFEKHDIAALSKTMEKLEYDQEKLQFLLFQLEEGRADAMRHIQSHWPTAIEDLKMISANAIANGYYLGAAMVLVATALSCTLLPRTSPK